MSLGSRRRVLALLGSFGLAQVLIAGTAVIRVPLIVSVVGAEGLGAIVIVGATIPILLVMATGLRRATATLTAESLGQGADEKVRSTVRASRRQATWIGFIEVAAVSALATLLPLGSWLGTGGGASETQVTWAFVLTALLCGLAMRGAVGWGVLDAHGRSDLVYTAIAITAVVGLAATAGAALVSADFLAFAVLNAATSTAPFYVAPVLARRMAPDNQPGRAGRTSGALRRAVALFSINASAETAVRGVDPFIVGGALGSTDAARYGVAQRMSVAVTATPTALDPLMVSIYSSDRGANRSVSLGRVGRVGAAQGAATVLVAVVYVWLAPVAAELLGGPEVATSRGVYAAFALLGILWAIYVPLRAAATGPRALRAGTVINAVAFVVNVLLSIVLVKRVGLVGPVYGSIVATVLAMAVWTLFLRSTRGALVETHEPRDSERGDPRPSDRPT